MVQPTVHLVAGEHVREAFSYGVAKHLYAELKRRKIPTTWHEPDKMPTKTALASSRRVLSDDSTSDEQKKDALGRMDAALYDRQGERLTESVATDHPGDFIYSIHGHPMPPDYPVRRRWQEQRGTRTFRFEPNIPKEPRPVYVPKQDIDAPNRRTIEIVQAEKPLTGVPVSSGLIVADATSTRQRMGLDAKEVTRHLADVIEHEYRQRPHIRQAIESITNPTVRSAIEELDRRYHVRTMEELRTHAKWLQDAVQAHREEIRKGGLQFDPVGAQNSIQRLHEKELNLVRIQNARGRMQEFLDREA